MLVITYTSEHSHPWLTQRNALAGSTRSQSSKSNSSAPKNSSTSDNQAQRSTNPKERIYTENVSSPPLEKKRGQDSNKKLEMTDDMELSEGFRQIYKLALLTDDSNHGEDFFPELGAIETDSLDLLLTPRFSGEEGEEQKAMNPFGFFNWSTSGKTHHHNSTSFGEAKKDS